MDRAVKSIVLITALGLTLLGLGSAESRAASISGAVPEFSELDEALGKSLPAGEPSSRTLRVLMRSWLAERPAVPLMPERSWWLLSKNAERALVDRARLRANVVFDHLVRARATIVDDRAHPGVLDRIVADILIEVAQMYADLRAYEGNTNRQFFTGWHNRVAQATAVGAAPVLIGGLIWMLTGHAPTQELKDYSLGLMTQGAVYSGATAALLIGFVLPLSPEVRAYYRRYDSASDRSRGIVRAEHEFWDGMRRMMEEDERLRPWRPKAGVAMADALVRRLDLISHLPVACEKILAQETNGVATQIY